MLFLVFYLLLSRSTNVRNIGSFNAEGRKVSLNLLGYFSDKVEEIYILETGKRTNIMSYSVNDKEHPNIFSIEIPNTVTEKFYIIIKAYPKVMKIGEFEFDNNRNVIKNHSKFPVIQCRYANSGIKLNGYFEILLSGGIPEWNYGNDYPTVKYHSEINEIFLDLSPFVDFFEEVTGIYLEKKNCNRELFISGEQRSVIIDEIKVFNLIKRENALSTSVLHVPNLSHLKENDIFKIIVETDGGVLHFGTFQKKKEGKFYGYKNNTVYVSWDYLMDQKSNLQFEKERKVLQCS